MRLKEWKVLLQNLKKIWLLQLNHFLLQPLPSPSELNVRQRAEVEVNDYLHTKKLPLGADPFSYWFSQNAIKWPMLSKLSTKLLSAPASSSESERVFSTTV
uniref:HAT C-terminal dimerisation domain-containing protein n=1 Tax=Meloidogyne enterolobii TaxID=390850 RepID=A0A6V7YCX7_MELEN|nr:unnamed protein product [Meloidogyne enterolobii]